MKKCLILIIFLILNLQIVYSGSWTVTQSFDCDGCCVEDKTFQYTATITNTGSSSFSVSKFELRNYYGSTIGSSSSSIIVNPNSARSFTLTGNIPVPSNGYLTYYICFYLSEQRTYWWGGTYTYSDWSCSGTQNKKVTSKSDFQCFTDANCANNQYCYISTSCTSQCLSVNQGSCGHVLDHKWENYECCSDSNCKAGKTCSNNYCVDISCSCGYVSNHQCIKYDCCSDSDCDYGYYCSDHSCLKYECMENKDCNYNGYCSNHKCVSLNCGSCQHIVDHTCINYVCCKDEDCRDNQRCQEHLCEDLKCEYGYFSSNHNCTKYECMVNNDCNDWQKCENNNCIAVKCSKNMLIMYHGCEGLNNLQMILGYIKENRYVHYISVEGFKDYGTYYAPIAILIFLALIGLFYYIGKQNRTAIKKVVSDSRRFCNKCGHKIIGTQKYCIKCGSKI